MEIIISNRNLSVLLLILASIGISFGGLIMRNIFFADAWQVTFFRALVFVFSISIILFYKYGTSVMVRVKKIGNAGFLGAMFLMIANLLFILSFSKTSIANTLFTLSSIPFITAVLASIFIREKISLRTFIIMFLCRPISTIFINFNNSS